MSRRSRSGDTTGQQAQGKRFRVTGTNIDEDTNAILPQESGQTSFEASLQHVCIQGSKGPTDRHCEPNERSPGDPEWDKVNPYNCMLDDSIHKHSRQDRVMWRRTEPWWLELGIPQGGREVDPVSL